MYISGIGISSSLGNGIDDNWKLATQHKSGISNVSYDEYSDHNDAYLARAKQIVGEDRLFDMTEVAFLEVLEKSNLEASDLKNTALVFAHGTPDNPFVVNEGNRLTSSGRTKPKTVYRSMNSYVAARLAQKYELTNLVVSNSYACAGSAQSIHLGMSLIKSGLVDKCICGGGEAIDYYTYNAFKSMRKVLSQDNVIEPFGKNRDGIGLGEGTGLVLLESEKSIRERQVKPYAQVVSSYFQNVPSAVFGDMPSAQPWIDAASQIVNPEGIDYVLAHATSTPKGDLLEGKAITELFPDAQTSSLKYTLGHSISASSALDIIFLAEGYKKETMLGIGKEYTLGDELSELNVLFKTKATPYKRAVKFSAGFGGGISCIELASVI